MNRRVSKLLTRVAIVYAIAAPANAAIVTILPDEFSANAVRIDFDELAGPTVLDDLYAVRGVVFDNTIAFPGPFPVSAPMEIGSLDGVNPITIRFPAEALKVGIQIDTDGYNPNRQPQIRAYDQQGILRATELFGQGPYFVGFAATSGFIARIVLGSCTTYGDSECEPLLFSDAYDNLVFELNSNEGDAVPEPGTATLLSIGAVGLYVAASVRRRSRGASPSRTFGACVLDFGVALGASGSREQEVHQIADFNQGTIFNLESSPLNQLQSSAVATTGFRGNEQTTGKNPASRTSA